MALVINAESTVEDVVEYLKETLKIPQEFCDIFSDNYIDGEVFLHLTKEDLCRIIKPTGIYCKIYRCIEKLQEKDKGEIPYQPSESASLVQIACSSSGTASKECGEWLSDFAIPERYSPRVERFFSGEDKVLGRAMRTEIINALYSKIMQHTDTPTSGEYNAVCQLLVQKFPDLKDEDP